MANSYITPNFLIKNSSAFRDYRCVVNGNGTTVIFERSSPKASEDDCTLYSIDLKTGAVTQFLTGTSAPLYSSRPDWCWQNGNVVFNCVPQAGDDVSIGYTTDGSETSLVPATTGMFYPTWFPPPPPENSQMLAVMNESSSASPSPNTSEVYLDGDAGTSALAGSGLWAGMPTVNQTATNLIAFAGQPVAPGSYNEDLNYIWWLDTATQGSASPLETGAPSSGLFMPQFQGRAPSWSPDGKWIAFESNRAHQPSTSNPGGLYSIFLYEVNGSNPAIQITDPIYNANHAKWYPNGFNGMSGNPTLTVAAYAPNAKGTPAPPYALASLDVSSIVGSSSI